MMMLSYSVPLMEGFLLSAGLIVGIGPQNTLILRQGLRRQHLLMMVLLCTLIDACLILLGTFSMGSLLNSQLLAQVLTYIGVAFLLIYGARSFWAMVSPASPAREAALHPDRRQVMVALLAVSLLNPSVYMDTMVLIGGGAMRYQDNLRFWFATGAILASMLWFWGLSYGSALLAPWMKQPRVLRVLDGLSGGILWLMAFRLLTHAG
jgi:L-lysine exporter family protein LysE/ArgO